MEETDTLRWCVVANVAALTSHGPGGQDVRTGLKHFSPGTKLWLVSPFWGYAGDRVEVLGRHRGGRRLVRMVVERRHLTNFRVQGVYSPSVLRELGSARPGWMRWCGQERKTGCMTFRSTRRSNQDDFLLDQLDLSPGVVLSALRRQVSRYRREPRAVESLLGILGNQGHGCPRFAAACCDLL